MSYSLSKFLKNLTNSSRLSEPHPVLAKYIPIKLLQLQNSRPEHSSSSSASLSLNEIKLDNFLKLTMSRNRRWFENPFPDYNSGEIIDTTKVHSIRKFALEKSEEIFSKGGVSSGDGGVYVGAVGCTYMIVHILDKLSEEERRSLIPFAVNAFQIQSMYFTQNPGERNDEFSFLLGKCGHYAVGAVLGQIAGNEQLTQECIQKYVAAVEIGKPIGFFRHGGDELFVGRAGYLCGALWLQQKLGYQPVPREDLKEIWTAIVESGVKYSKRHKSPCPLMYSYYDTEYLGAAHGLSAILQILISFPVFLNENEEASKMIKASIDFYLTLQTTDGNYPCAMDELGPQGRHPDEMLIHWCHGAPGAVYLFAKAYKLYNDPKYLNACIACGDLMWTKGLLRKGPGICHGVAGNGYVFLVINDLLGGNDPKCIYRAKKFAEFLDHPLFLKEARRPDSPYSLFEGWAGTVCYLMDLLEPQTAEFPFFNLNSQYIG